jgi:hypothetical protein
VPFFETQFVNLGQKLQKKQLFKSKSSHRLANGNNVPERSLTELKLLFINVKGWFTEYFTVSLFSNITRKNQHAQNKDEVR